MRKPGHDIEEYLGNMSDTQTPYFYVTRAAITNCKCRKLALYSLTHNDHTEYFTNPNSSTSPIEKKVCCTSHTDECKSNNKSSLKHSLKTLGGDQASPHNNPSTVATARQCACAFSIPSSTDIMPSN